LVVSTANLSVIDEFAFMANALKSLGSTTTAPIRLQAGSGAITTTGSIVAVGQTIAADKTMTATNGSVALVAATDVTFSNINSPLEFVVGKGTTLATGVAVGPSGAISGQSVHIAGGSVETALMAALLKIDPAATVTATANGGSIVLATASTGPITIVNEPGTTPAIESLGTLSAQKSGGDVLARSAGILRLDGSITAGRNVTASSADNKAGIVTLAAQ
jgi:hypothetical protein